MEITYVVIVFIITYIFGSITKCFIDSIPNKFIPIQNVSNIEPNLLQALVLCFMSAVSAGGTADIKKVKESE